MSCVNCNQIINTNCDNYMYLKEKYILCRYICLIVVNCFVSLKIAARAINNPALNIETNECAHTEVESIHVAFWGKGVSNCMTITAEKNI